MSVRELKSILIFILSGLVFITIYTIQTKNAEIARLLLELQSNQKELQSSSVQINRLSADKEFGRQQLEGFHAEQAQPQPQPQPLDTAACSAPLSSQWYQMPATPVPLEAFPQSLGPYSPPSANKSLVLIAAGEQSRELVGKLVTQFGLVHFTYVIFLYDRSDWSDLPWADSVIWIRVKKQVKYWYIKRFISPSVAAAYRTVWLIDDDVDVEHIDPVAFVEVMDKFGLQAAQPAIKQGYHFSHAVTVEQAGSHTGRYSSFVEIGPVTVFTAESYACVWHLVQPEIASGWGLDVLWVDFCKFKKLAIIDKYPMMHISTKTISSAAKNGGWNYYEAGWAEQGLLFRKFPNLEKVQSLQSFARF